MKTNSRDRQMAVYAISTVFNDYPTMPEIMHEWTASGAASLASYIKVRGGKRWQYAPQLAEVFAAHRAQERRLAQAFGQLAILLECKAKPDEVRKFVHDVLKTVT